MSVDSILKSLELSEECKVIVAQARLGMSVTLSTSIESPYMFVALQGGTRVLLGDDDAARLAIYMTNQRLQYSTSFVAKGALSRAALKLGMQNLGGP